MDFSHFSELQLECRRDRLSELPDSLLHEILSRLETREVVWTSLLSKRWKDVWMTFPCLYFLEETPSFISGVVAKWRGAKILNFTIVLSGHGVIPTTSDLDSWLHFAIEKQVEDLSLFLSNWEEVYCAPPLLYSCSSIRKLTLYFSQLNPEENVQWNQLKSLTIVGEESVSNDAMNRILSGAPHLEELILDIAKLRENLSIRSSSLKMLEIRKHVLFHMLTIWAPNLLTLNVSAYVFNNGSCLFDVPSSTDVTLHFKYFEGISSFEVCNPTFRSIRRVEKLTLSDSCIKSLLYMRKEGTVVPFSAKFLTLYPRKAEEMHDVLHMFPELVTITIVHRRDKSCPPTLGEETHVAMVDACNSLASNMTSASPFLLQLKTVEITWNICDAAIIPVTQTLLVNAHSLEKLVLRLRMSGAYPETFILAEEKVMSMPRSSPTAQLILIKLLGECMSLVL